MPPLEIIELLETNSHTHAPLVGLSSSAAEAKLAADGPNTLEASSKNSFFRRILKILHEPMFVLLLAAAAIYMSVGDLNEGLTLGVFVLAVLGLTLFQEGKSENSIQALRELNSHQVQVVRDGTSKKTSSKNIVKDDLVIISEGGRIPADGVLIKADNIEVDESLLTGESISVIKNCTSKNLLECATVYSGTYVTRGQGVFKVTATGARTEVGKIGNTLNRLETEVTPLHRQTARLVKILASIGLGLCTTMVITLGLRTGEWIPALLSGIALAMAMLPEEYPVVLAIFPALGAHRLAKQGVLTRHINAIETLGATTILCTDKTGTLTQNRMTIQALAVQPSGESSPLIFKPSKSNVLAENFHRIVEHAILASSPTPFDPMEVAFHDFGAAWLGKINHLHKEWKLIQTYPLSTELRAMSNVWSVTDDNGYVISAKGAPEAVMDLCHMTSTEQAVWKKSVDALAAQGLRVLAAAEGKYTGTQWPKSAHDFEFEWLGLIGLADPLREEVPKAMAECQTAGIRVIMITGDYPTTAQVIAMQAGMPLTEVMTGEDINLLNDSELQVRLKSVNVCARISPHQKLRIVEALKRNGEIVTMTGDGVNDAPALRSAHVGVSMGLRGTDVAREASDLVLIDDNFASIVRGIRTGRRIFSNLQKSMAYIFAIHIPLALIALMPVLFALPPLFLPLHIALLEMVIDPACSLAFENEPESSSCMTSPPRDTNAALFGITAMGHAFVQGILVLISASIAYWTSRNFLDHGNSIEQTRTMVMVAFVVANGCLIFISKSNERLLLRPTWPLNWTAITIALGSIGLVVASIYLPWLSSNLRFSQLTTNALAAAMACGSIGLLANLMNAALKRYTTN